MIDNQPQHKPEIADVLMTAVLLAAEELANVYPQPYSNSTEIWKGYLLKKALTMQENMSLQERIRYRTEHLL